MEFVSLRSVSICILLLVVQLPFLDSKARGEYKVENPALQQTLSGYRSKVSRIQQSIQTQEEKIHESRGKEHNLLGELEKLDKTIISQQQRLDELDRRVLKQQILIDSEQEELELLQVKRKVVENHLQKRITAYYTMGNIGILNVTFSSKTLPELLSFHDSFDSLIQYDQSVILKYKTTIEEQQRIKGALVLEKSVLEQFKQQAVEETNALVDSKSEKKQLLRHIRTQSQLHQQAIKELQNASEELVSSIVSIKNKNQILEKGFLDNKGSLPPPVKGRIITRFLQKQTNKFGVLKKSRGVEFEVVDGAVISAINDGQVIFSGYLRGFGNTVIIHHGFQHYTVTSRIEKLIAKKGQSVTRSQSIGIVGDTAILFDNGLYFEIRHGKESLDPLDWLNPDLLSMSNEQ